MKKKLSFEFSIRKAQPNDAERISGFLKNEAFTHSVLDRMPDEIKECQFFIATCNDQLIGTIGIKTWSTNCMEVVGYVVKKKFRKNGIGGLLASACIFEAMQTKAKKLFVLTTVPTIFRNLNFVAVEKSSLLEKIMGDCSHCKKNLGNWDNPECDEIAMQLQL